MSDVSAAFPHSADNYTMYYGVQVKTEKTWENVDSDTQVFTDAADIFAYKTKKGRDVEFENLKKEFPDDTFRKTVVHVIINTIPVPEEKVVSKTGKTKTKSAKGTKSNK